MSKGEKLGYLANLERCKAQQTIHLQNYSPTDYRGVYDLYLTAYGDENLARKAQAHAAEAFMDQQCNAARAR